MADCNDLFQEFHNKINLTSSKRDDLKVARRALRDRIKKYFKEVLEKDVPRFRGQGSYAMSTIVNPIDGEYDIDDGVYLQSLDPNKSEWPSPETVHNWVYDAVKEHTSEGAIDKRTCIRVVYSGQYHVDLPAYGMCDNSPYLAEKGEAGWHVSDPKAITDWFLDEVKNKGEQLKKIVRYLKAWADYQSRQGKLPGGLVLTVLTVNNYKESSRDDVSFYETIKGVRDQIADSSIISNPVDPEEHLSDNLTDAQVSNFGERLSNLVSSAEAALDADGKEEACKKWEKEFGSRFPVPESKRTSPVTYPLAASGRHKPWSTKK